VNEAGDQDSCACYKGLLRQQYPHPNQLIETIADSADHEEWQCPIGAPIARRGKDFTAQVFEQLAQERDFIHALIARHRPESNGIAERFVRTLKEWLADKSWQSAEELTALLDQFRAEYNDRPHQGIPIPGLSPNEFANRIWLM
jgi:transposase InsO family protein